MFLIIQHKSMNKQKILETLEQLTYEFNKSKREKKMKFYLLSQQ